MAAQDVIVGIATAGRDGRFDSVFGLLPALDIMDGQEVAFTLTAQDTEGLRAAPLEVKAVIRLARENGLGWVILPPTVRLSATVIDSADDLTVSGKGAPDSDIVLLVDRTPHQSTVGTGADGQWMQTLRGPWKVGSHEVQAINQDGMGSRSEATSARFTVRTKPEFPVPSPVPSTRTPTPTLAPTPTPTPILTLPPIRRPARGGGGGGGAAAAPRTPTPAVVQAAPPPRTPTPTIVPTVTPAPTSTPVIVPTAMPTPTSTPFVVLAVTPTRMPTPLPTSSPRPSPTTTTAPSTPMPKATPTLAPVPTATAVPLLPPTPTPEADRWWPGWPALAALIILPLLLGVLAFAAIRWWQQRRLTPPGARW